MDSITHIVLGAALGELFLRKKIGNKGAILGAIIATIPDLDILFVPFFDDYQKLVIHRGYSHSILFCLLSAIIIEVILYFIISIFNFDY